MVTLLARLKGYAIVAGVAIAAAAVVAWRLFAAGKDAARNEVRRQNLRVKDAQAEAAARRPRNRRALAERLRNGEF